LNYNKKEKAKKKEVRKRVTIKKEIE